MATEYARSTCASDGAGPFYCDLVPLLDCKQCKFVDGGLFIMARRSYIVLFFAKRTSVSTPSPFNMILPI